MEESLDIERIFNMDTYDRKILSLLYQDPTLSYTEIGKAVGKSGPAVGARLLKLERAHLISMAYGLNVSKFQIPMAFVKMQAKDPSALISTISGCPFVINVFTTTGPDNIMVWMIGSNINKLEEIIDSQFRSAPGITKVKVSFSIESLKEIVLPVDYRFEMHQEMDCKTECKPVRNLNLDEEEILCFPDSSDVNDHFSIDDDDKRIMMYLQADPTITHSEIGQHIGKSQPAVGTRIAKLRKRDLFRMWKGVNFKHLDQMHVMEVWITSRNVTRLMEKIKNCSHVLAGFRVTGEKSIVALLAGHSIQQLQGLINGCFRRDEDVQSLESNILVTMEHDLILPYAFDVEEYKYAGCPTCHYSSDLSPYLSDLIPELSKSYKNSKELSS